MMVRRLVCAAVACAAVLAAAPCARAASAARYYFQIAPTEEEKGLSSGLVEAAQTALREALAKRPEVVLDLGPDAPTDPAALGALLKKRNLHGFKVFVRLLAVESKTVPPRPGRQYKQLEATVRASLVGITLPGDQIAIGGDGESTAATEFGGTPKPTEVAQLKQDALVGALAQAVDRAMAKLAHGFRSPLPEKARRRK
jgi:hypothetical protein